MVLIPGGFLEPGMLGRLAGRKIVGVEFDHWVPPDQRDWIGLRLDGGDFASLYIDASSSLPTLVIDFHARCEAPARDSNGQILWRCQLQAGHGGEHR